MKAVSVKMKMNVRILAAMASLAVGVIFVVLCEKLFEGSLAHVMLFGGEVENQVRADNQGGNLLPPYPFTVQNLMWLVFFLGCGEIWTRYRQTSRNQAPINDKLLPETPEIMLRAGDLGSIYKRVTEESYAEDAVLPRLIQRTILQFQSSRSINQANSILNSTLELCQHEIELRYSMLRYLVWLIPTLGFIGTVIGIAQALLRVPGVDFNDQEAMGTMMGTMIGDLGIAFFTTFLALLQSAVLVFALNVTQAREERVLNRAGQYCLDNLINRLYEK